METTDTGDTMNQSNTTTTETTTLTARECDGTWVVDDANGGTWQPGEKACAVIAVDMDPASAALQMAALAPMMGDWLS